MQGENAAAESGPPAGARRTVLVVEDDSLVRDLVDELLTGAGYRVLTAADADESEAIAAREPTLDAIVVDTFLPGGGGATLAGRLRAVHPNAGVLIVSGWDEEETVRKDTGLHFLAKPFTGDQLRDALRAIVSERSSE